MDDAAQIDLHTTIVVLKKQDHSISLNFNMSLTFNVLAL